MSENVSESISGYFSWRRLELLVEEQSEERADLVRLSVYFIIAYIVFLVLSFIILKCVSKFDLIYGLVRYMRKSNPSLCCIKTTTIMYLLFFILCPIIIALAWSLYIYEKSSEDDAVIAAAIFLMVMFSTFVLLGSVIWYGAKWFVSKGVIIFFGLGAFAAWVFTLTVALTNANYSFQGVSAILLSTNFIPACYILQKKTVWKDIPLFGLFKNLAKSMSLQTEA